ncbi:MAG: hypothetical protein BGO77_02790 [Caedibacter sp. 37-49]|mgnify:CR=1 FL=1|nr:MAG: hypothetical protein BGO77_02790 [Caedibacter sp. 37-49]
MRITIQMIIHTDDQKIVKDISCLERQELSAETLGLTLEEAKVITSGIQETMTAYQVSQYTSNQRACRCCGKPRLIKGYNPLIYRTLFGILHLKSPRLLECDCQKHEKSSFSPLTKILHEHTAPELLYLESKWSSLMSYGTTVKLLEEVFPVHIHPSSVFDNMVKVSTRLEEELGKEQIMYIEGCQQEWDALPRPGAPLTVGLDGGYVHAREDNNRKAGWFEVIVGKSLQEDCSSKRFGFVVSYDTKPKRKLYELLKKQGLQNNQDITFLTDGCDDVRELPLYLSPKSEHIIDWFHITMKITVIKQMVKGMSFSPKLNIKKLDIEEGLERVKWCVWHGNVFKALKKLESLGFTLEDLIYEEDLVQKSEDSKEYKLWKAVDELQEYLKVNSPFIPNYGERYRYGEHISTAFAESTVNEVISKRMVKQQQMRWTKKGAHQLLQVRIKTLNEELRPAFETWYPNMKKKDYSSLPLAA